MSLISKRLKELRIKNEYTQDYIAMRMHIGRSTYTHWETGKYTPDVDKILWLCNFYKVSADYLLGRTETPTDKESTLLCVAENIPEYSSNTIENTKLFVAEPTRYSSFTEDDEKILNYYHRLDEENQDYIRGMMIKLYKEQTSENNDMKTSDIG